MNSGRFWRLKNKKLSRQFTSFSRNLIRPMSLTSSLILNLSRIWRLLENFWSPVEPFWSHWRLYRSHTGFLEQRGCFYVQFDVLCVAGQNGAISSISLHATAGSDVTDDLESFTQEPLQPKPVPDKSFPGGGGSEGFVSSQPFYSGAPPPRTDLLTSLDNLALSTGAKTEEAPSFAAFSRPADLSSVGVGPRVGDAYPSFPGSAPAGINSQVRQSNKKTTGGCPRRLLHG